MSSGRCTAIVTTGRLGIQCTCTRGRFTIAPHSTLEVRCQICDHFLSEHQDDIHAALSPAEAPSLAREVNYIRCPRKATVEALWERLQQVAVVHVRGTPASGKSTLARLLEQHVQDTQPHMPIFSCSWAENRFDIATPYHITLNTIFGRSYRPLYWASTRLLLIIDEAQGFYSYTPLWNHLIKGLLPESGPLIVLFSSYGSPSSRTLEYRTPTPYHTYSCSESIPSALCARKP
ncbi:hypothetical protein VTN77DRAFT_3764 [Rasamsonia byssochlamydoides]|uniref:uncharacterized protein n=1 Tax=Rasamsonia byssochlamydoides TaxID=89139 RepID=UPI003743AC54